MGNVWENWSGSVRCRPALIARPQTEAEVVDLVRRASLNGASIRVVGAGHSSVPLAMTDDVLVSLEALHGLVAHHRVRSEVTLWAGTTLHEAGTLLQELGLAFDNLGDIDQQTVAGALATGTHGTGTSFKTLSHHLVGVRMITAGGEIVECTAEHDPETMRAAQVSLGVLGIVTQLTLRLVPAFRLRRREWCTDLRTCLAHLDELQTAHRSFDFYWYPRSDEVKLRTWDLPDHGPANLPYARCVEDRTGWSAAVLPKQRSLKFEEIEYAVPAAAGPACFDEVRRCILERHRKWVGWRVLYRTLAADDAFLSMAHGRDTVTISPHQNVTLPWERFFREMETIFGAFEGRPHWGKKHWRGAQELRPLYPAWDRFLAVRRRLDPGGRFLTPYLRTLLGKHTP